MGRLAESIRHLRIIEMSHITGVYTCQLMYQWVKMSEATPDGRDTWGATVNGGMSQYGREI